MYKETSSTSYKPHSFPLDRVHPSTSSLDWQLSMGKTSSSHLLPILFFVTSLSLAVAGVLGGRWRSGPQVELCDRLATTRILAWAHNHLIYF